MRVITLTPAHQRQMVDAEPAVRAAFKHLQDLYGQNPEESDGLVEATVDLFEALEKWAHAFVFAPPRGGRRERIVPVKLQKRMLASLFFTAGIAYSNRWSVEKFMKIARPGYPLRLP